MVNISSPDNSVGKVAVRKTRDHLFFFDHIFIQIGCNPDQ